MIIFQHTLGSGVNERENDKEATRLTVPQARQWCARYGLTISSHEQYRCAGSKTAVVGGHRVICVDCFFRLLRLAFLPISFDCGSPTEFLASVASPFKLVPGVTSPTPTADCDSASFSVPSSCLTTGIGNLAPLSISPDEYRTLPLFRGDISISSYEGPPMPSMG